MAAGTAVGATSTNSSRACMQIVNDRARPMVSSAQRMHVSTDRGSLGIPWSVHGGWGGWIAQGLAAQYISWQHAHGGGMSRHLPAQSGRGRRELGAAYALIAQLFWGEGACSPPPHTTKTTHSLPEESPVLLAAALHTTPASSPLAPPPTPHTHTPSHGPRPAPSPIPAPHREASGVHGACPCKSRRAPTNTSTRPSGCTVASRHQPGRSQHAAMPFRPGFLRASHAAASTDPGPICGHVTAQGSLSIYHVLLAGLAVLPC